MTTTDLWITDLSGGRSLRQRGGLFGPASDIAYVLMGFISAGRATAHPDHNDICDVESTVSGDLLIEILQKAETNSGRQLVEEDGRSTIACVSRDHRYRVRFIEF